MHFLICAESAGYGMESIHIPLEQPHAWGERQSSRRMSARPSLAHARRSFAGPELRSSLLPLAAEIIRYASLPYQPASLVAARP